MYQNLPLRCADLGCGFIYAHLFNGTLIVDSRHHGSSHANAIALAWLIDYLEVSLESTPDKMVRELYAREMQPDSPVELERVGGGVAWALPLRCRQNRCALPWAHVYGGILQVQSFHDSEKHYNVLTLEKLRVYMKG